MSPLRSRWLFTGLTIAYAAAIFALSSRALPVAVEGPEFPVPHVDKVLHFLEYAVLGVLAYRALEAWKPGWPLQRTAVLAGIVGALYGVTDEIHQATVPGRTAGWGDVVADAIGAAAAATTLAYLRWKQRDTFTHPSPETP